MRITYKNIRFFPLISSRSHRHPLFRSQSSVCLCTILYHLYKKKSLQKGAESTSSSAYSQLMAQRKRSVRLYLMLRFSRYGLEGSRTPVQKPIQCPSTIIDGFSGSLPFPPQAENSQSTCFSSFMIRPRGQSLPRVVSRFHNAGAAGCGCPPDDGRHLSCQCYSIIVSVYF